jgi:ABC transport system ATP-binding/permease protein
MHSKETDIGIINVGAAKSIRLGRAPENDRVLEHPAVSAVHARLDLRPPGAWWVSDLDSTHGTFVNNRRVGKEGLAVRLDMDTLWIAPFALRISAQELPVRPRPAHLRLDLLNLERRIGERLLLDLKGTPLSFRPGEFTAIVGGSGAGKSTLLKALLGMDTLPGRGRSGEVYFNNQLLIRDAESYAFEPLNSIVGYVPQQDDSLHFQLTPLEALDYTARLRFAADLPAAERKERVQQALAAVRLEREELQRKPIANLSGGQRKRVNVAMELVAEPRLIFLDEPTSGLDPGLDLEMMSLLQDWALGSVSQDPKTIVLITHATENVRLCDNLIFMGRVKEAQGERGGCLLYYGPPGEPASRFFGSETFSEAYRKADVPTTAARLHQQLVSEPEWNIRLWERARTPEDIRESQAMPPVSPGGRRLDFKKIRGQFGLLARRYFTLLSRDRGAFIFQLFQGALVALLLWSVAQQDAFTAGGVRAAPTTLFIMSIAATWLGILNAAKEIVKERRVYGRERRYGVGAAAYVLSKFAVLGGLGLWQAATLVLLTALHFQPEERLGAFGRALGGLIPLELEWFISLELMLLAGVALGLLISAFARSLDQATMLMFPAMLVQVLLSGLLFDVGALAWTAFTHWGLQALGNSLDLQGLYAAAGKASDPILDKLDFAGSAPALLGYWAVLILITALLVGLTIWRQSWQDKARIPED